MKKIKYSEITPEKIYKNRRSFIKSIGLSAGSIAMTSFISVNDALSQEEKKYTSYKDITTYNNYYEFGTSKSDPYINSQNFKKDTCIPNKYRHKSEYDGIRLYFV